MKKYLKITLIVLGIIALCILIDFICIFTINRPLFAIRQDNGDSVNIIYKGILYDTYNCHEHSSMQIVFKGKNFSCDNTINIKKFNNYDFEVVVTEPSKYEKKLAFIHDNVNYYYGNTDFRLFLTEGSYRYDLETSLKNELVTLDDILTKNKNVETYRDGGSKMYYFNQFNILVCNTINGNKDVVVGDTELKIGNLCN